MSNPFLFPKLRLTAPTLPPFLSDYEAIAEKLPSWSVRAEIMSKSPRHLYKYLRFDPDSEISVRNLRTMLVDSHLYLSDPADFNDPFEFKIRMVLDDDKTLKDFLSLIFRASHPNSNAPQSHIDKEIESAAQRIRKHPHEIFGALFETHAHGVHCLTPHAKSQLMWSHYGDSHKGICLQFRTSYDVKSFLAALPVDYCDDFPDFHIPSAPHTDTRTMMLRKGKAWEYEGERRIVIPDINERHLPFKAKALTGLILGSRFPNCNLGSIQKMLNEREEKGHPCVRVYRAQPHAGAYRLSIFKETPTTMEPDDHPETIPWVEIFER